MEKGKILNLSKFKYAIEGFTAAFKLEPTIKLHLLFAVIVISFGFFVGLTLSDWVKVIMLIGSVLAIEFTNTAIEVVVNSFTTVEHPGAKLAKDVSATAVLVVAVTAAVCGLIIFLPYLFKLGLL